ncbi:hypothetical protein J1N35_046198 [Gossypium stocksii]|uniref:Uncharacterized protein n=1 Tax=Gossypium stocksii TaxID=47602 RepID=A0A9D3U5C0_9ROSI|nr:hypothetical protein J1N35_046198 [Gossypium stocksii]
MISRWCAVGLVANGGWKVVKGNGETKRRREEEEGFHYANEVTSRSFSVVTTNLWRHNTKVSDLQGNPTATQTKNAEGSSNAQPQPQPQATPAAAAKPPPKKPVYSITWVEMMELGLVLGSEERPDVKVDKDKYLNSINYLSVGHPPYYKGLDYIYEDRGETLEHLRLNLAKHDLFTVAWVGIPTAPAWLPTDMLIKSEKLQYERL